ILVVVLLSVLYASPNLFQKDPAVQVTKNRTAAVVDEALASRVRSILEEAGITTGTVELHGDQVLVRLPDAGTQTLAADALRPVLGEDYSAALNLVPTTPAWLEALGARPMSLGLDLQGGVHFMMQVDQKAALEKRVDAYADAIRVALRDARIGYTSAERRPDASVLVNLVNADDAARARDQIQQAVAGLSGQATLGGGPTIDVDGSRISVRLSEAELARIATDAIEQNRNVISNRINAIGVAEPSLQRQGDDRLVIQLPGLQDTAEAKRLIGATATLEFRAVTGGAAQAAAALADNNVPAGSRIYHDQNGQPLLLSRRLLVSGDELVNAQPQVDAQTGQPAVSITLNAAGGKRMLDHTLENVGNRLGIVYVERIP